MPTATYTPIASQTLSSSAASVTFSSIPSTYRDLLLVFFHKNATATSSLLLRVNGSSSSYSWVDMEFTSSNTVVSRTATPSGARIAFATTYINFGSGIANIMDYSQTDKTKTIISRYGNADSGVNSVEAHATRWDSTSAITSLTILQDNYDIAAGSTFSLYGVIA